MSTHAQNGFESVNDGTNAAMFNAANNQDQCREDDLDFTTADGRRLNLVPTCTSKILLSDTVSIDNSSRKENSEVVVDNSLSNSRQELPRQRDFTPPTGGNNGWRRPNRVPVQDIIRDQRRYPDYIPRDCTQNNTFNCRPPIQHDEGRTVIIIGDSGSPGWGNNRFPPNVGIPGIGIPDIFGGHRWPGTPGIGDIGIPDIFGGNPWPGTQPWNPNHNPGWNWGNRPVWGRGNGPTYPGSPGNDGTYTPTIPDYTDTQDPGDFGNNNGGNDQGYDPLPNDTYTPTIPDYTDTQDPGDFGNNNGGNDQGYDPLPNDTYTPTIPDYTDTQDPGDFGNNNNTDNGQGDNTNNGTDVVVDETDNGNGEPDLGYDPMPNDTYTPTVPDYTDTQDPGDFGNNNNTDNGQGDNTNNGTDVVVDETDNGSGETDLGYDPMPNDTYTPTIPDYSGPQDQGDFGNTPIDLAPVQPYLENGAGLNFDTPTEFAANGNVPDFILDSNGNLTQNPAKEVIGDDGVIDVQVNNTGTPILSNPSEEVVSDTAKLDDDQSRAEKDANESQKAKIKELIRHFQKNNPGKPIPQEWTDILNSQPETSPTYNNGGNDSGVDMPNQTPIDSNQPYYPSNDQGGGGSYGGGSSGFQPNIPFLGNRDYEDFRRNNGILPPGSNGTTLSRDDLNNPSLNQNPIADDWRYPTNDSPIQNTPFDREPGDSDTENTQPTDHKELRPESNIESEPTMTAEKIDEVLESFGSPAAGMGQHIYDEGVRTGINPALALAVFAQETGAGTQGDSANSMNIGDVRSGGNPNYYQSWEEGITDWFNNMDNGTNVGGMIEIQTQGTDTNNAVYLANINGLMESWDAQSVCETTN